MRKRLAHFFELPFDPYDEKSNREQIISSLINMGVLILGAYLVPAFIQRGFRTSQIYLAIVLIILLLVSRYFIKSMGTELVSIFLVSICWIFVNYIFLFYENGIRAPGYMAGMIFLIIYTGLLHGPRSVVVIATISVLTGVTVAILESQGVFFVAPEIPDIVWVIVAQVILFPATAYMVTRTLQNLKLSISMHRDESERLYQSEQRVIKLNQELEKAYETTLEGWARALEFKDKETEGHSRRVTELTILLARRFNFNDTEIKYAYYGALLHDIGKMAIPDEILKKPGKLTPEEQEIINQHPGYAYQLLNKIEYLGPALSIPYSHHENWDGTGYPQGLQGEEIPLSARIFSVVDNWDALSFDRPYRHAWPKEKTIDYLKDQSNKKFDPKVVEVFIDVITTADYS